MGGNLSKSPLIAVFYAGMLWFAVCLQPRSAAYTEVFNGFVMPRRGLLFLVAYGLWAVIAYALVFSHAKSKGIGLLIPLAISALGLQWFGPMTVQLLRGETTGVLSVMDTLFQLLGGFGATVLMLLLSMLLFKREEKPLKPGAQKPVEPKYKLNIVGLVIRLLVLPVIFMLLYYLVWYFLLWQADTVREFYGMPDKLSFMASMIDILINDNIQVAITLLKGLAYALFSLPLLLQLPGKRVMFIIANAMLYLLGALLYLIPSPVMPIAVAMAHLIETAALMLLYGMISSILLHTAMKKQEVPVATPNPVIRPGARPASPPSAAAKR